MYIMLSIHPEYANKIFIGQKKWEYRKSLPKAHFRDITGVVVYATAPVSRVIGHFETDLTMSYRCRTDKLWHGTDGSRLGGITKEAFDKYFEKHEYGYAIPVQETVRYLPGVNCVQPTLEDFGLKKPPQGFAYLTRVKDFMSPNTHPMVFNTLLAYCEERKKHIELTNVVITHQMFDGWLGSRPLRKVLLVEFDWMYESPMWERASLTVECEQRWGAQYEAKIAGVDGQCTLVINPNNEEVKRIIDDTETRETIKYYFAHNVYEKRTKNAD